MSRFTSIVSAIVLLVALSPCAFGQAINYQGQSLVPVGNAGNSGVGAVAYNYYAGQYDVTISQYCQFLNATANVSDPYGEWTIVNTWKTGNNGLNTVPIIQTTNGDGTFSYAPASGTYTPTSGPNNGVLTAYNFANVPIYTNWGSAARYTNWLDNGRPTGLQGPGITETGAYALNGATTDAALALIGSADRSGAFSGFVLPTTAEWYKAAFYNPGTASYNTYTTGSNTAPTLYYQDDATHSNTINAAVTGRDPVTALNQVTAHYLSLSSYGLYDAGGNAWQYDEYNGSSYGDFIGGSNGNTGYYTSGSIAGCSYPSSIFAGHGRSLLQAGFREYYVGTVTPEPGTFVLLGVGLIGLLCYAWRKRR